MLCLKNTWQGTLLKRIVMFDQYVT
jgi:hypothetical protein